jgi:hypothetical protein
MPNLWIQFDFKNILSNTHYTTIWHPWLILYDYIITFGINDKFNSTIYNINDYLVPKGLVMDATF